MPALASAPHAPALVLAGVFAFAGSLALLAAVCDWDWFFDTSSARSFGSRQRRRARVVYGIAGLAIVGGAVLIVTTL